MFCMDTQNDEGNGDCEMLSQLTHKRVVVGSKQLRKALEASRARHVFLARNADPAITEPIEAMCRMRSVAYTWVPTMLELGRACGIDVGAAAAAAVD